MQRKTFLSKLQKNISVKILGIGIGQVSCITNYQTTKKGRYFKWSHSAPSPNGEVVRKATFEIPPKKASQNGTLISL